VGENWQYAPASEFAVHSCCNCDIADEMAKSGYIGAPENRGHQAGRE
jgi:hypothetical protein